MAKKSGRVYDILGQLCADKMGDRWQTRAFMAVCAYAKTHSTLCSEDIRNDNPDLAAHDDRAWGPILTAVYRDGLIEPLDYRRGVNSACHSGVKRVWKSLVFKEPADASSH